MPPGSPITAIDQVDQPGVRIASAPRAAYDLWLERNLRHAELVRSADLAGSFDLFVEQGLDALAGLRPGLLANAARCPARACSTAASRRSSRRWARRVGVTGPASPTCAFVEEMKATGFVAERIAEHGAIGLTVAPPDSR